MPTLQSCRRRYRLHLTIPRVLFSHRLNTINIPLDLISIWYQEGHVPRNLFLAIFVDAVILFLKSKPSIKSSKICISSHQYMSPEVIATCPPLYILVGRLIMDVPNLPHYMTKGSTLGACNKCIVFYLYRVPINITNIIMGNGSPTLVQFYHP